MKKFFIAFCLVLVTGCTRFNYSDGNSKRFVVIQHSFYIAVIKDTYTGEQYLVYNNGSGIGLTHLEQ